MLDTRLEIRRNVLQRFLLERHSIYIVSGMIKAANNSLTSGTWCYYGVIHKHLEISNYEWLGGRNVQQMIWTVICGFMVYDVDFTN